MLKEDLEGLYSKAGRKTAKPPRSHSAEQLSTPELLTRYMDFKMLKEDLEGLYSEAGRKTAKPSRSAGRRNRR